MRISESELSLWILCGHRRGYFVSVVYDRIRYGVIRCVCFHNILWKPQMEA